MTCRATLAALAVVAVVAVASGCGGSSALSAGVVVYGTSPSAEGGDSSWIWRARADGSHAVRLTRGFAPDLSPDGRLIGFYALRSDRFSMFLMPITGGRPRLVRGLQTRIGNVIWAPDSKSLLAFGDHSLFRVDAASGTARPLRVNWPAGSEWSVDDLTVAPDGSAIAYGVPDDRGSDLYVYSLASGRTRQLTFGHYRDGRPAWGPHGIAFARFGRRRGDLWVIQPDGRGLRRLTHTLAGVFPTAWSADGSRLLAANEGRVMAVDVDSGLARDLLFEPFVGALAISKDGTTILAATRCRGIITPRGVIETLPFSGGEPTVVAKADCSADWTL